MTPAQGVTRLAVAGSLNPGQLIWQACRASAFDANDLTHVFLQPTIGPADRRSQPTRALGQVGIQIGGYNDRRHVMTAD